MEIGWEGHGEKHQEKEKYFAHKIKSLLKLWIQVVLSPLPLMCLRNFSFITSVAVILQVCLIKIIYNYELTAS